MSVLFRGNSKPTWDQGRVARAVRHIAVIGIAGVITGILVGGVGGRIFMRISAMIADDAAIGSVTENGNVVGDITITGTIGLVFFVGLFFGIYGAVIYVISEPWLSWAGPLRGVAFGLLLLATASVAGIDPENPDFSLLGDDPRNVMMLAALFIIFGPVLIGVIGLVDGRVPRPRPGGVRANLAYVVIAALGLPFLIQLVLVLTTSSQCGCEEPPVVVGVFVILLATATTAFWIDEVTDPERPTHRGIMVVGYASLLGVLVAGALRAAADIGRLI